MASPYAERATEEALEHGKAILKFISKNDVGLTGGHQCGYYLPKAGWDLFTPHPPEKGDNKDSWPTVTWQNGQQTESRVVWYGKGTRSEYRMTRFGRDFPFIDEDTVGDLLVLIPKTHEEFSAYVLDLDDDIEEINAALGVEVMDKNGAVYRAESEIPESEDLCMERQFQEFARDLKDFPSTTEFSEGTQKILEYCIKRFLSKTMDDRLVSLVHAEYELFRRVERMLCSPQIQRLFKSVDDFLKTASSIMNRRKSRAGRALENHFEYLLKGSSLPFDVRPKVDGEPDVLLPSREAYEDSSFPDDKLFMVGVKTTCKDRWRQVLNEAKRIPQKHILTMQPGISPRQLEAMREANVTLIVPNKLHREYPKDTKMNLLTVEEFVAIVAERIDS